MKSAQHNKLKHKCIQLNWGSWWWYDDDDECWLLLDAECWMLQLNWCFHLQFLAWISYCCFHSKSLNTFDIESGMLGKDRERGPKRGRMDTSQTAKDV